MRQDRHGIPPYISGAPPDSIARCVLKAFHALPKKSRPRIDRTNAVEWVPLCGIVFETGSAHGPALQCVALATGSKCLPASQVSNAEGIVLHDSHAEILAIRALNLFLLDLLQILIDRGKDAAMFVEESPSGNESAPRFRLRRGIVIHMYCSEAPCGDASMELVMNAQDDATPWSEPVPPLNKQDAAMEDEGTEKQFPPPGVMDGRGHFSRLGVVRRKPARPDAPQSWSKSCSDKLALKQLTSLLNSTTALLFDSDGLYLDSLVVPESQCVESAMLRCFHTRMLDAVPIVNSSSWESSEVQCVPLAIQKTSWEFEFSRRREVPPGSRLIPSNIGAAYTWHRGESLINGRKAGGKAGDLFGASMLCRQHMWQTVHGLVAQLQDRSGAPKLLEALTNAKTYGELKRFPLLERRRAVKERIIAASLQGWVPNVKDENFVFKPRQERDTNLSFGVLRLSKKQEEEADKQYPLPPPSWPYPRTWA